MRYSWRYLEDRGWVGHDEKTLIAETEYLNMSTTTREPIALTVASVVMLAVSGYLPWMAPAPDATVAENVYNRTSNFLSIKSARREVSI